MQVRARTGYQLDDLNAEALAATKIQAQIRGNQVRNQLEQMDSAALMIQSQVRGMQTRARVRQEQGTLNEKELAATKIQAQVRGIQVRDRLEEMDEAAVRIQSQVRGIQTRGKLQKTEQQDAAIVIQAQVQGIHANSKPKIETLNGLGTPEQLDMKLANQTRTFAAAKIQAQVRGMQTRDRIEAMENAAVSIQARARGMRVRNKFSQAQAEWETILINANSQSQIVDSQDVQTGQKRRELDSALEEQVHQEAAAKMIQSQVRAIQARKKVKQMQNLKDQEKGAVILIQSQVCGSQARNKVKQMNVINQQDSAAVLIQSQARRMKANSQVQEMRTLRDQQQCESAAVLIQSQARGMQARAKAQQRKNTINQQESAAGLIQFQAQGMHDRKRVELTESTEMHKDKVTQWHPEMKLDHHDVQVAAILQNSDALQDQTELTAFDHHEREVETIMKQMKASGSGAQHHESQQPPLLKYQHDSAVEAVMSQGEGEGASPEPVLSALQTEVSKNQIGSLPSFLKGLHLSHRLSNFEEVGISEAVDFLLLQDQDWKQITQVLSPGEVQTLKQGISTMEKGNLQPLPLPAGKRFHTFISHQKKNTEGLALSIYSTLSSRFGLSCFYDGEGFNLTQEVLEANVRSSCCLLAVLDNETVEDQWCKLEWRVAHGHNITIIPVYDKDLYASDSIDKIVKHIMNEGCGYVVELPAVEFAMKYRTEAMLDIYHMIGKSLLNEGEYMLGSKDDILGHLRKITPLPTGNSSTEQFQEFIQLHGLKLEGMRGSDSLNKEKLLEKIKLALLLPKESGIRPTSVEISRLPLEMRALIKESTKPCKHCGHEVLTSGYEVHFNHCKAKAAPLVIPSAQSSIQEIQQFVRSNSLNINMQLQGSVRTKQHIIDEIIQQIEAPTWEELDLKVMQCELCGLKVLKQGYGAHYRACKKRATLVNAKTMPTTESSLWEIREYVLLHSLEVGTKLTDIRTKGDMVQDIKKCMKAKAGVSGSSQNDAKVLEMVHCELCNWQILKSSYALHLTRCEKKQKDLKKEKPMVTAESDLWEIREFTILHDLNVDTRLSQKRSKKDIVDEIQDLMNEKREYPKPAQKEPDTARCGYCGCTVLNSSYERHLQYCEAKWAELKQGTELPTEEWSLWDIQRFVAVHGLDVDTKLYGHLRTKGHIVADIQGKMPANTNSVRDIEMVTCEVCKGNVLKPSYKRHVLGCKARRAALKISMPQPTPDTSLWQIWEYISVHALNVPLKIDGQLRPKKDLLDDIQILHSMSESNKPSTSVEVVTCSICNSSMLKPGYLRHIRGCSKKMAKLKEQKDVPTSESSLWEMRQFIAIHSMDIDTRLRRSNTKEDIANEIEASLSSTNLLLPEEVKADPEIVHCEICGWKLLAPGYETHLKRCKARKLLLKEIVPVPTVDSPLSKIRDFVALHDLDIETRLTSDRSKEDILHEIKTSLPQLSKMQKGDGNNENREMVTCDTCNLTMLKPGYKRHKKQCLAKQKVLQKKLDLPTAESSLWDIRKFVAVHSLDIDCRLNGSERTKEHIVGDIRVVLGIDQDEGYEGAEDDPETMFCGMCGIKVLKTSFKLHARSCKAKKSLLKQNAEVPTMLSSLWEIREFVGLHGLDTETRISSDWTKEDMILTIQEHFGSSTAKEKKAVDTRTCHLCGQKFLKPGYAQHLKRCGKKQNRLKQNLSTPTTDSSLWEIRNFVALYGLNVDTRISEKQTKEQIVQDIQSCLGPKLKNSQGFLELSAGNSGIHSVHCMHCGKKFLKPGYTVHLTACRERQEKMKNELPIPSSTSSLWDIQKFVSLHNLDVDTRLTQSRSKEDTVRDAQRAFRSAGKKSEHLETVDCEFCGIKVLQPGYPSHRTQCQKWQDQLKEVKPLPTSESSLWEIREFVSLHALDIDVRLGANRTKEDIILDIQDALPEVKQERKYLKSSISTQEAVDMVECPICGSEVLEPGFQKHYNTCAAKQTRLKSIPNESAGLYTLREFVILHKLDVDTRLSTTRKKSDILLDIKIALNSPMSEFDRMKANKRKALLRVNAGLQAVNAFNQNAKAADLNRVPSSGELFGDPIYNPQSQETSKTKDKIITKTKTSRSKKILHCRSKLKMDTVSCGICGLQMLKSGYPRHYDKCQAKLNRFQNVVGIPAPNDDLYTIREFAAVHQLNVNTRLASDRTKMDIIIDIKKALSTPLSFEEKQEVKRQKEEEARRRINKIRAKLGPVMRRASDGDIKPCRPAEDNANPARPHRRYSVDSAASPFSTMHCSLCGLNVLKPSFTVHVRNCKAKKDIKKKKLPTRFSSLQEIKEFVKLNDLKIDASLSGNRSKETIVQEIEEALVPSKPARPYPPKKNGSKNQTPSPRKRLSSCSLPEIRPEMIECKKCGLKVQKSDANTHESSCSAVQIVINNVVSLPDINMPTS